MDYDQPSLAEADFDMHEHDSGACCECGESHCCCECPVFEDRKEAGYIEPDSLIILAILVVTLGAFMYLLWHIVKAGTFWM